MTRLKFIKTCEGDQELLIEFKNRAVDFKAKDPEAFFMPFAEGGRSIGLPLCYRLLKDIGGVLSFMQKNGYMAFTVSLPKKRLNEDRKRLVKKISNAENIDLDVNYHSAGP